MCPPSAIRSGFSLHPDGKKLRHWIRDCRRDIWVLEGFRVPSGLFGTILHIAWDDRLALVRGGDTIDAT